MSAPLSPAEQAAQWFEQLRGGELDALARKRFADWFAESPVNVREYLAAAETWSALQSTEVWPRESKEDLVRQLQAARLENVVALKSPSFGEDPPSLLVTEGPQPIVEGLDDARGVRRRNRLVAWTLAAAAVGLCLAVLLHMHNFLTEYRTGRGEQHAVTLSDGTLVQLNTLSKIVVHFDERTRRIELPQGEAYFRVALDPRRPFEVRTPYAQVRALGTAFDVYNRADSTQIAVVEGKVAVASLRASNPQPPAILIENQQITVTPSVAPKVARAGAATATAWIQRRIVLDNDRIDAAVAEFNRYSARQLRVDDADLAALRITGLFNADDPGALVTYLQETQGVRVQESGKYLVLKR